MFSIAAGALLLVGLRVGRVPSWTWPMLGVLLLLLLGRERPANALWAIGHQWNVILFIAGLMAISAAAEESGAFAWVTRIVLQHARGSRRRLFVLLFFAGAVLTLLLSNDATAIVLTPLVFRVVAESAGDATPYLLACSFVANTASFGLPFSNPANVLILPHARLAPYLYHLAIPQAVALLINLAVFLFAFRTPLRGRFAPSQAPPPSASAVRALATMAAIVAAYLAALALHWPLGPVALAGGAATLLAARIPLRDAARRVSWGTLVLLAALFALLDAVARSGFTQWAARSIDQAATHGMLVLVAACAGGAAILSNLLNNLPIAVAASYVVAHEPVSHLAYPLIVGVDVGPNLTLAGSLATILWLRFLREKHVRVDPAQYVRLGLAIVPATIATSALWLWFVAR